MTTANFESQGEELLIDGHKVIKAWESFSGWYWFATEKVCNQKSLINGKEVDDTIYFGLVQGIEEEWGHFSQAEIESLKPMTWEIKRQDLPYSGRRN